MKKETISPIQIIYFMISAGYGSQIYLHSKTFALVGRGTWIAEASAGIVIIILSLVFLYIAKVYPGYTIFEILEITTGNFIGKVFGIFHILLMSILSALFIRLFAGMIQTFVLHFTPLWFIVGAVYLLAAIIASGSFEKLARINIILTILFLAIFFMGLGLGYAINFESTNIFPIFESNLANFADAAYITLGGHGEVLLFFMVMMAAISKPSKSFGTVLIGSIYADIVITIAVLLTIPGIVSPQQASRIAYAGVNSAQIISIGRFVQGLELFVFITYEILAVLKGAINLNSSWIVASHISGGRHPKLILITLTVASYILCLNITSINAAYHYSIFAARFFVVPFIGVVLLTSLLSVLIKGKKAVNVRT